MLSSLSPSRTPRILLTTDAVGGVWRYTMELAAGLRALGVAVKIVSLGPAPSEAQLVEAGSLLHVTSLPLDWLATSIVELARSAEGVASIAREWGADTVHLHMPALVTLANWTVPVIAVAHSCVGTWWRAVRGDAPLPPELAWRAELVREGLASADRAITPSRSFARQVTEHYRLERPVHPVLNGRRPICVSSLSRAGVLTAGRLWDEAKNMTVVDQAAKLMDEPITVAGPVGGPNGAFIRLPHLHLLGTLGEDQLAREYARAEVFVSAARYEPFGLSVLEAAQAGCALVLSDIPTFRELWDGAALFVEPDDPAAFAAKISLARREASTLSRAARRRARLYTRERMAEATLRLHRMREVA